MPGQISVEEHQIIIGNACLKEELNRICTLTNKFLGKPISSFASLMGLPTSHFGLELDIGRKGIDSSSSLGTSLPMGLDFGDGVMGTPSLMPSLTSPTGLMRNDPQLDRSMLIDLALAAMEELVKMTQTDNPLWMKSAEGGREVLNNEEYARLFSPCIGPKPTGYVTKASRETGFIIINSLSLVKAMMDALR